MRPSALRLLFAFLVAASLAGIASSCSSTEAPGLQSCADSCNGCCEGSADGGETCVPFATQGFAVCGHSGATCRACVPGQICSDGECLAQPDAGVDSGTDAGTDAGVDAGTDSGTDTGCGREGEPCCHGSACYLPLVCGSTGTCTSGTPDAGVDAGTDAGSQPQAVGAACGGDGGCTSKYCLPTFPGGYCTTPPDGTGNGCTTNADCPSGSKCGYDQEGTTRLCLATCTGAGTQGSCRSGYVCDTASSQSGDAVCVPKCTGTTCASCSTDGFCCGGSNPTTGHEEACCAGGTCNTGTSCSSNDYCAPTTGPQPTGSACGVNSDCTGNDCIPQSSGSGCGYASSETCWANGYCTQQCQADGGGCAAGSSCANFGSAGYLCLDDCTWNGGAGDCRTGYVCDRFVTTGANSGTTASCVNACGSDGDCPSGTACSNGFCCGAAFYRCCAGNTCNAGLACQTSGPNTGYCQ